jgi:predicted homoserine dehydrogenase-like protein
MRPASLAFPPCGTHELADVLRPGNAGALHHAGQVEVISSVHRDGGPVRNDLRWGVFVAFEAPSDYAVRCFQEYGVVTDPSGRITALYRPFHLIGLELNVSILSAALRGEATGAATGFRGDVVATAKRDLRMGEILDGEGGACVWGKLMPAADSLRLGGLPIGLANKVPLVHDIPLGAPVTWADVRVDEADAAYRYRRDMEAAFA